MTDELIIVKAQIQLKTPAEGGMATGIKSGYRPNHAFEQPEDIKNIKTYIGDTFPTKRLLCQEKLKL